MLARKTLDYFSSQPSGSVRLIEDIRTLLAEIYLATGRPDDALGTATLALDNQRKVFPITSLNVAHTVDVVGAAQRALGSPEMLREAVRMHSQSVAVYTSQLGADHVLSLRSQLYLALVRLELDMPGVQQQLSAITAKLAAQLPEGHPALQQLAAANALADTKLKAVTEIRHSRTEKFFSLIDL